MTLNYKILLKRLFLGVYKCTKMRIHVSNLINRVTRENKYKGRIILSFFFHTNSMYFKYEGVPLRCQMSKKENKSVFKITI